MKTEYNKKKVKKVLRYTAVVLAAVVIFATTYSLILPALTLEQTAVEEAAGITLLSADDNAVAVDAQESSAAAATGTGAPLAGDHSSAEKTDEVQPSETMPMADAQDIETHASEQPADDAQKIEASKAETSEPSAEKEQENSAVKQQGSSSQKAEQQDSAAKDSAAESQKVSADAKPDAFPAQSFEAILKKAGSTARVLAMEDAAADQQAADVKEKKSADQAAAESIQKQADARKESKQQTELFATIRVEAGEGAFPAGTFMKVADVSKEQDVKDAVAESVGGKITSMQAFDISFYDKDGKEIEPAKAIKVSVISDRFDQKEDPEILHISETGRTVEHIDQIDADKLETVPADDEVVFEADSFSVYVFVYTVDFHYDVNEKTYDFSIPGGGFVSFTDLVEVLGIAKQDAITASEFVSNIAKIEFSDERLIQVAQITDDITAQELKEQLNVEPMYSADLTEAEIAENLAQKFYAPDWVLVSLKAFDTEETLTVTMKNGDVVTVKVTDAQDRTYDKVAIDSNSWNTQDFSGTYVFYSTDSQNALSSNPKTVNDMSGFSGNSVSPSGNQLKSGAGNNIEWTLSRPPYGGGMSYYISTVRDGKTMYLRNSGVNSSGNVGNLSLTENVSEASIFSFNVASNGQVYFVTTATNNTQKVLQWAHQEQMFYTYNTSYDPGNNSKFTLYKKGEQATGSYSVLFSGTHQNMPNSNSANDSYHGAEDRSVTIRADENGKAKVVLPADTTPPANYKAPDGTSTGWKINGWYDVTHDRYYGPSMLGQEVEVDSDTMFYADWVPVSYNYGQDKSALGGTLQMGTNVGEIANLSGMVTTEVYDFSSMFNINDASKKSVYEDGTTWKVGDNDYAYIFFDDNSNKKGSFDNPENRKGRNLWTGNSDRSKEHDPYTGVYDGSHSSIWGKGTGTVAGTVFDPVSNLIGSHYLGVGDGLFYLNENGYYEYDSAKHAASYNQSEGKFYVYNSPQYTVAKDGQSTAFLPLNAENNGYSKYGGEINYWFGIKTTINFAIGDTKKDNQGKDLIFEFSGDDDVWVVVDGILRLDLGGIHSASSGTINFTNGTVTVNGQTVNSGIDFSAGQHTLEFYYLERGASDSNCKITFNLPLERPEQHYGSFGFDKLDQFGAPVEGAKFALFRSAECIQELEWDEDEPTDDNHDGKIEENEHHYIHHKAEVDAEKTLAADGFNVHFTHIPVGTYYLEEIHIPDGYNGTTNQYIAKVVVGENESFIYLRGDDQQQKVTKIINEKLSYGSVSFNKKNIDGEPVSGAEFKLYKDKQCTQIADAVNGTAVSGDDGKVTFGGEGQKVQAGNYYMKETSAPGEYVQSGQVYFVHIAEDGTSDTSFIAPADDEKPEDVESYANLTAYYRWKQTDTIINERVHAAIKKVDENGKALLGAEFTLTKVNKSEPHDAVTGSEAYTKTVPESASTERTDLFAFEDLGNGYYKVEETKAPEGYTGLSSPLYFEVKDGEIIPEQFPQGVFFAAEGIAVMNLPVVLEDGSVQVRKHWLDENDRAVEGTEDVEVTLHRKKLDAPAGHKVTFTVAGADYLMNKTVWLTDSTNVADGKSLTIRWKLSNQNSNLHMEPSSYSFTSDDGFVTAQVTINNIHSDISLMAINQHGSDELKKDVQNYGIHFDGGSDGPGGTGNYIDDNEFITRQSQKDSGFSASQKLTAPNYAYTWKNLDLKDENGNPYKYYITEDPLSNYSTEILNNEVTVGSDGKLHGTVNVYNKKSPIEETGMLTVDKKWFKGSQDVTGTSIIDNYQIRFGLYRQEIVAADASGIPQSLTDLSKASTDESQWVEVGEYTISKTTTGSKGNVAFEPWKATISDLPKSRTYPGEAGGTYYVYKVKELQILENGEGQTPGDYSPEYVIGQDGASITIRNKVPTTSITVKKVWSDNKNDRISFVLYKVGSKGDDDEHPTVETTTYNDIDASGEGFTIEPLDVKGSDGVAYTYVVAELAPEGYTPTYHTSGDGKVWTITNTKNAGTDKTTKIRVEKVWKTADGSTRTTTADDNIQFKLTPWKLATDYVPVVVELVDSGQRSGKETTYYVKSGKNLTLSFKNEGIGHYVTVSGAGLENGIYSGRQNNLTGAKTSLTVSNINSPKHISVVISEKLYGALGLLELQDVWGDTASNNTWTCSVSSSGTPYKGEAALVHGLQSQTFTELPEQACIYNLKNNTLDPKTDADSVEGWAATIGNLPWVQYDSGTGKINLYRYELSEISVNGKTVVNGKTEDFTVSVSQPQETIVNGRIEYKGSITNTENERVSLELLKVDKNHPDTTLADAQFSITQIDETKIVHDIVAKGAPVEKTTGDNGKLEFNNLAEGYYEIKELKSPGGYVITGDNAFYIHITAAKIDLLQKDIKKAPRAWQPIATKTAGNVLSITEITDSKATIKVANEPGVALPSTGGPGTRIFTILGSILVLGASVLLWRKRKLV